jgi:hypothetical protein
MGGGEKLPVLLTISSLLIFPTHRHIFTGIAQYFNLTWSIWLRYCFNGEQDDVELVWPSLFTSVPAVQLTDMAKSGQLRQNGREKRS